MTSGILVNTLASAKTSVPLDLCKNNLVLFWNCIEVYHGHYKMETGLIAKTTSLMNSQAELEHNIFWIASQNTPNRQIGQQHQRTFTYNIFYRLISTSNEPLLAVISFMLLPIGNFTLKSPLLNACLISPQPKQNTLPTFAEPNSPRFAVHLSTFKILHL